MLSEKGKPIGKQIAVLFASLLLLNGWGLADRLDLTDINRQWLFSYYGSDAGAGAEAVDFNDASWDSVDLPHTWNAFDAQNGGGDYERGFGWYRKYYTISSDYSDKRVYLFFEAVGKKADVYYNGTQVGNHLGGYAAFCYDITDYVNFGVENVIAVRADNANTSSVSSLNIIPQSGDFNQYGGICRKVHVIVTEPVHITLLDYASPGVYLTPTNVTAASADLAVKTLIRNADSDSQTVTVRAMIYDANDVLVDTLTMTQSIPSDATETVTQNTALANPHLWNGRIDPYLYKVVVEVQVGDAVVDSVEQPLGFRYFSVDVDDGFFLNGKYLDLHGVAMHEDWLDKGRAVSDADREQDNALMLEMGCTWIRPSHYQHAEKFYDLCDESGFVISSEIPIVNGITLDSSDFDENCKDQLKELIRQNYNHPSICFWLLYNELTTSGADTLISELNDLAYEEDPTRLTSCAHNNTSTDYTSFSYITDTLAYNRYMGWYGSSPEGFSTWADEIHASRSSDAIGVTEYGAGANAFQHQIPPEYPGPYAEFHPEEYQSYYHEVYWMAMKERPFLWCKTIWNGFDFAVDGREEGGQPGLNDKGMVTRDRAVKKDVFYWYKANWTTEPMVYITSRRYTHRYEIPEYIRVYSNCETVELWINGVSLGSQTGADHIFTWDSGIILRRDHNIIEAIGTSGESQCSDRCVWDLRPLSKLEISSVTASYSQSGNEPENSIDGDFGTWWAAPDTAWITYDLGSEHYVGSIGISFYGGNLRQYTFDIDVSNDSVDWTTVSAGVTDSLASTAVEEFAVNAAARYVRMTGYGNTGGAYTNWSSYVEVEIYGCHPSDLSGPSGVPDCLINHYDFAEIASHWQESSIESVTPTDPGTENLVVYYALDGDYDDAAGSHHATPVSGSGTLSFVNPGHSGQSVEFDGDSALECADSNNLDLTSGTTVSAWIKSDGETDAWACVVAKGLYSWRLIRNDTNSTMSFHFNPADGGSEFQANGSTDVFDDEWHHLMAIYDGTEIQLYVDGQLDASTSTDGAMLRTSEDPVYIGSRLDRISDRSWDGQIDEVRIYNTALGLNAMLWLSEGDSYATSPDPTRLTDLYLDGQIDIDDLLVFSESWLERF